MHWLVGSEDHLVMRAMDQAPTMCQALHWAFCVCWLIEAFCCSGQKSWSPLNFHSFSLTPHLACPKILSRCHHSLPEVGSLLTPFNTISHHLSLNYGGHFLTSLPPSTDSLPQFISQQGSQSDLMKMRITSCHYHSKNFLWLPISLRIKAKVLTVACDAYRIYLTALHMVSCLFLAFALAVLSLWHVFFQESAWSLPSPSDFCSNNI